MNYTSDKFKLIIEANRVISSTLNIAELLRQVMRLATEVVEAETSSILLYDEKTDEFFFDIALGEKEDELKQVRLKSGEGIAGWVAKNRKTQVINDVASDPRWAKRADAKTQFKTRSIIAVPLVYRGALLGIMEAINKRAGEFSAEDGEILEAFAAQAAVSIVNARTFESLKLEKDKIEAVFSQMSDGAVFADTEGACLFANQAAEKLLGMENVSRKTVREMFAGFDAKPGINELLDPASRAVPFEFVRTVSKTLCLSGLASRIYDSKNTVIGSILVFRDVTAEKKETVVKRNFLSLISHKLKTPLVTITGYGPLLLDDPTLGDFQKKAIQSIAKQGAYLLSLVEKLLHFTMIDEERLGIDKSEDSFERIAESAVNSLRAYLEEKKASVSVLGEVKQLKPVMMDSRKIEAAVKNLIENAVKFNSGAEKTVEVGAASSGTLRGIYVKDNGPGIPPEEREKIFNKFYQIEESFTGQVEGAGLGLALVKQITEGHGGRIVLETAIGSGSSFSLLLPEK